MNKNKQASDQNNLDINDSKVEASGFLPIQTNWFDRGFISVVIWIAFSLFWFRFIEPLGASIWICNAISLALGIFIIKKG